MESDAEVVGSNDGVGVGTRVYDGSAAAASSSVGEAMATLWSGSAGSPFGDAELVGGGCGGCGAAAVLRLTVAPEPSTTWITSTVWTM